MNESIAPRPTRLEGPNGRNSDPTASGEAAFELAEAAQFADAMGNSATIPMYPGSKSLSEFSEPPTPDATHDVSHEVTLDRPYGPQRPHSAEVRSITSFTSSSDESGSNVRYDASKTLVFNDKRSRVADTKEGPTVEVRRLAKDGTKGVVEKLKGKNADRATVILQRRAARRLREETTSRAKRIINEFGGDKVT